MATSRGFQVNVMPQLGQVDPRLFNTGGQLIGGFQSGLGAYGALQNIADEAAVRPARRRLQDIQLAEAENRALMAPLEQARRRAELAQPIQSVTGFDVERVPLLDILQPMVDEEGVAVMDAYGNPRMENIPGSGGADVFGVEIVTEVDPVTGERRQVRRRKNVLSTSEQLAQQASLIDSRDAAALAAQQRIADARELGLMKIENDRIKANAAMIRAKDLEANPGVGFVDVKKADGRTYRQYFPKSNPQEIMHEIDRGEIGGSDIFNFGGTVVQGAKPGAVGATPSIEEISAKFRPGGAKTTVAIATPQTLTVEQAIAAPPGTKFLGTDGKLRIKNPDGTVSITVQ